MVPALPVELLVRVVCLLNESEPLPAQRQLHRNALRLVSRLWCSTVDRWREVYVTGRQVRLLAELLEEDVDPLAGVTTTAGRLRRLYVDTAAKTGLSSNQQALCALLRQCVNAEFALLRLGANGQAKTVTDKTAEALAAMASIRHFTLDGAGDPHKPQQIRFEHLQLFLPQWPQLESLSLRNLRVFMPTAPAAAAVAARTNWLSANTQLASLAIHSGDPNLRGMSALFANLPASVTQLALELPYFDQDDLDPREITLALVALAPQLEELSFLCEYRPRGMAGEPWTVPPAARLDPLVGALVRVRKLTLPAWAVADWSGAFAPLRALEELALVDVDDRYAHGFRQGDLLALLGGLHPQSQLARLRVPSHAWARASEAEQGAVKDALAVRGITLGLT